MLNKIQTYHSESGTRDSKSIAWYNGGYCKWDSEENSYWAKCIEFTKKEWLQYGTKCGMYYLPLIPYHNKLTNCSVSHNSLILFILSFCKITIVHDFRADIFCRYFANLCYYKLVITSFQIRLTILICCIYGKENCIKWNRYVYQRYSCNWLVLMFNYEQVVTGGYVSLLNLVPELKFSLYTK